MPNWFTNPLVPQSAIQGTQDALTEPQLNQSPAKAAVKGFGAGALQGLRSLTSPSQLLSMASLALPGIGEATGASRLAGAASDVPESILGLKNALPEAASMKMPTSVNSAPFQAGAEDYVRNLMGKISQGVYNNYPISR